MSENVVLVVNGSAPNSELRDKLIQQMNILADDVYKNEPGSLKYFVCVPREDDGKSFWVFEEYANQAAFDLHAQSDGVKNIREWSAQQQVAEAAPVQLLLNYISSDFHFSRPEAKNHDDPHLIFAQLDYIPGGVATATPYWKAVVDTGREKETGTLAYGVLKDPSNEERLYTLEAYESPEYLKDVHVPSDAISESIKNTKHLRTGLKHNIVRKVAGFVAR